MRLGVAFVDLATARMRSSRSLRRCSPRERTGRGQSIDVALFDSGLHFLANIASRLFEHREQSDPLGNAHPSIVTSISCSIRPTARSRSQSATTSSTGGSAATCSNARSFAPTSASAPMQGAPATAMCCAGACGRDQAFRHPTLIAKLHANGIPGGELRTVAEAFASEEAKARGRRHGGARPASWRGAHGALAAAHVRLADHRASRAADARGSIRVRCWAGCWIILLSALRPWSARCDSLRG